MFRRLLMLFVGCESRKKKQERNKNITNHSKPSATKITTAAEAPSMANPIREARQALWKAAEDGDLDVVERILAHYCGRYAVIDINTHDASLDTGPCRIWLA